MNPKNNSEAQTRVIALKPLADDVTDAQTALDSATERLAALKETRAQSVASLKAQRKLFALDKDRLREVFKLEQEQNRAYLTAALPIETDIRLARHRLREAIGAKAESDQHANDFNLTA